VNKNGNNIALQNIYPQITLNPKPTHSKKIKIQVSNNPPSPPPQKKPPSSCSKTN
jgi:hypothetical protein